MDIAAARGGLLAVPCVRIDISKPRMDSEELGVKPGLAKAPV